MTLIMMDNTARLDNDQAREPMISTATIAIGSQKSFQYDGQTYTLNPEERKDVPEEVARRWSSADSEVNVLWDGFE